MDTTVTISRATGRILDKLCKSNKCTKKDFLNASLKYFEKHGINPLTHESPAQEMQKLIRRIDQVIAFIRQQEKEILRPACEAIFSSEERIKLNLTELATKQELKDRLERVSINLRDNLSLISQTRAAQEEGFKALARLIDAKERTGVFMDLSKAYNQT